MKSSWLCLCICVGVFAIEALAQVGTTYLGDGSSLPGHPQYYLMADADTSHVGPNEELKRTQRSFWKKLFKNTGLPDLFGDDDCTPCCNYNNNYNYNAGDGDDYTTGSPPSYDNNPYYPPFQQFKVPSPLGFLNKQLGGLGLGGSGYGPRGGSYGGNSGGGRYGGPPSGGFYGGPGGPGYAYSGSGRPNGGNSGSGGPYGGGSGGQSSGGNNGSGGSGYQPNSVYGGGASDPNGGGYAGTGGSGDQSSGGYGADSDSQSSGDYGTKGEQQSGGYDNSGGGPKSGGYGENSGNSESNSYNSNTKSDNSPVEYQSLGPASAPESDNVYSDGGGSQYNSGPSQPNYGSGNRQPQQPQILYQPIIYVSPQYQSPTGYGSKSQTAKDEYASDYDKVPAESPDSDYGQNNDGPNSYQPNDDGYGQNSNGPKNYGQNEAPTADNKVYDDEPAAPTVPPQPAACPGSCGGVPWGIPILGIAPLLSPCQGCGAQIAPSYQPQQSVGPSASYGQNSALPYGPVQSTQLPYNANPSNYVSIATPVQNSRTPYGIPAALSSSPQTAPLPQGYGVSTTYNGAPSDSLSAGGYRTNADSQGISAVSHIHTIFSPISTPRSYNNGPSSSSSCNGASATPSYSAPVAAPCCTGPLTVADQPYRDCPELFTDYNIRMSQYNNAQLSGY